MNIGTLTGAIEIEDQASDVLDKVMHRVDHLGDVFEEKFGMIGMAVGVATAAVVAFTAAVTALAVKGSDVNDVTATFEHFAEAAGGAEVVLQNMRRGVKGTVDDLILMKDANRALSANVKLTSEDFSTLTEAAFVLQNRGLGTTEQMLNMVTSAMVTGRTRTLAMTIGVVDSEDATRKYADSLGLAVSQLTATQQAEGRRITVLGMLKQAVGDAGVQELDFAEKLDVVITKMKNWVDELASAVAASPNVAAAFDAIVNAFKGFGDSGELMDDVVQWINKFADAVTQYGPTIINVLIGIKNWISSIWTAVVDAWDTVPDWMKEIAKVALITGFSINTLDKLFQGFTIGQMEAGAAAGDTLGTISNYGTITDAGISVGKLALNFKNARGAIQGVAEHWRLMTPAMDGVIKSFPTLLGKFSLWTTIASTSWELLKVGNILWGTHKDKVERAAGAQRQAGYDASNLTKLNAVMGTSYTDVNEASAAWIALKKKEVPVVTEASAALARNTALMQAHANSVQAVVDSIRKVGQDIDVARDAYKKLGDQVLFNKESQDMFTAAMDKMIESGRSLTAEEDRRYDIIVRGRIATRDYGQAKLETNKITLEEIEAGKALGLTQAEQAHSYDVSTEALKRHETALKSLRDVTREVSNLELKASGHNTEVVLANREREYQDSLRNFQGTAEAYAIYAALMRKKKDAEAALDHVGTAMSISDQRARADGALAEYQRMAASGNYFREDLDKQLDLYRKLKYESSASGQAAVAAEEAGKAAAQAHNAELEKQKKIKEELRLQDKIKEGAYTLDAFGKATKLMGFTQDIVGQIKPIQVTAGNVLNLKNNIEALADEVKSFKIPQDKFEGVIDAGGGGLTAYKNWVNGRVAVLQQYKDKLAQIEYLQKAVAEFDSSQGSNTVAAGGGSGVTRAMAAVREVGFPSKGLRDTDKRSSSGDVNIHPGGIVIQYPLMQDGNAINKVGAQLGEAIVNRMKSKGIRVG